MKENTCLVPHWIDKAGIGSGLSMHGVRPGHGQTLKYRQQEIKRIRAERLLFQTLWFIPTDVGNSEDLQ